MATYGWVFERQRKAPLLGLTRSEQRERSLVWAPDSRELYYVRDVPRFDVFRRAADASRRRNSSLRPKSISSHTLSLPTNPSPLLLSVEADGCRGYLGSVNQSTKRKSPELVLGGIGRQVAAAFSPDGKGLRTSATNPDAMKVYVVPYPSGGRASRQQISLAGGELPKWDEGRKVHYTTPGPAASSACRSIRRQMWSGRRNCSRA